MENKENINIEEKIPINDKLNIIKSIIMLLIFLIMIAAPLFLTFVIGTQTSYLYGETQLERPKFSASEFISGEYQRVFELWFSRNYPLREDVVKLYNRFDMAKDNIQIFKIKTSDKDDSINNIEENDTEGDSPVTNTTNKPNRVDTLAEPKFPEYELPEEELIETVGYRGTGQVVIGKSGVLYENGYINEYYGFAQKYVNTTDEYLINRVQTLKAIQDGAAKAGKAFMVVITPSKATNYAQYIPDWYMAQFPAPSKDYVRPYIRFLDFLDEYGVCYVDSQSVYKSVGLTNVFPKTGIHWNNMAAYETVNAMITEYERQMNTEVRHQSVRKINMSKESQGDYQDIFGIVYSGRSRDNAIVDDWYYYPEIYIEDESKPPIQGVFVQGGSFRGAMQGYLGQGLTTRITEIGYNNGGNVNVNWNAYVGNVSLIVIEVNEQFVYGLGGPHHGWADADFAPANPNPNIVDSLYNYVIENWSN